MKKFIRPMSREQNRQNYNKDEYNVFYSRFFFVTAKQHLMNRGKEELTVNKLCKNIYFDAMSDCSMQLDNVWVG